MEQGIKFFEPMVVDAPKDVDFEGIVNTVQAAKRSGELMVRPICFMESGTSEKPRP